MKQSQNSPIWQKIARLFIVAAILVVASGAFAGPGSRFDLWGYGTTFNLLRWSFYLATGLGLFALTLFILAALKRHGRPALGFAVSAVLCGGLVATLYVMRSNAGDYVPIHNVTTDLDSPPAFEVLAERSYDPLIVPDRGRPDLAPLSPQDRWRVYHKEAYGDIQTMTLAVDLASAMEAAEDLARDFGWEVAHLDKQNGRLEATATTPWIGFKDDVVIVIEEKGANEVAVDMRSVSRVGISDIGANAKRIRHYLSALEQAATAS